MDIDDSDRTMRSIFDKIKVNLIESATQHIFITLFGSAIIIGIAFSFFYYVPIHYLPQSDMSSFGTILIAIACIGLILIWSLVVPFFFGIIWGVYIDSKRKCDNSNNRRSFCGELLRDGFLFCLWAILYLKLIEYQKFFTKAYYWLYILLAIIALIGVWVNIDYIKRVKVKNEVKSEQIIFFELFVTLFLLGCAFLLNSTTLLLVIFGKKTELSSVVIIILILALFNFLLTSVFNTSKERNAEGRFKRIMLLLIASMFTLILFFPKELFSIPKNVFSALKLGNYEASFIVSKDNSYILEQLGIKSNCNLHDICKTENIKVLSNLGSEYYIEMPTPSSDNNKTDRPTPTYASIPKILLLSPSIYSNKKDEDSSGSNPSHSSVDYSTQYGQDTPGT